MRSPRQFERGTVVVTYNRRGEQVARRVDGVTHIADNMALVTFVDSPSVPVLMASLIDYQTYPRGSVLPPELRVSRPMGVRGRLADGFRMASGRRAGRDLPAPSIEHITPREFERGTFVLMRNPQNPQGPEVARRVTGVKHDAGNMALVSFADNPSVPVPMPSLLSYRTYPAGSKLPASLLAASAANTRLSSLARGVRDLTGRVTAKEGRTSRSAG